MNYTHGGIIGFGFGFGFGVVIELLGGVNKQAAIQLDKRIDVVSLDRHGFISGSLWLHGYLETYYFMGGSFILSCA